jgi:hypothetical protein
MVNLMTLVSGAIGGVQPNMVNPFHGTGK